MRLKRLKLQSESWKPHVYQKKAVKFLLEHACGALLLDPGLGKTSITLAAIKILKQKKVLDKVLLVAPLRACHLVWPAEVEKWSDFNGIRVQVLWGKDKDQALETEADVYVINPEGLDWLLQTVKTKDGRGKTQVSVDLRRWKKLGFDTLVIDELTKFKNHSSDRFKAMKCVIGTFRRRWGLTGSPAANGLEQLFGQFYMLDEGRSLGKYITHYRNAYFLPDPNGFGFKIRKGAEEEIYERLRPVSIRMSAEDHLDMPQLIYNNIYVDLPEKVRKLYDELEDDLVAMLEEGRVSAPTKGVAIGKCRQVANGGVFLSPEIEPLLKLPKSKREWVQLHDAKTEALAELVDELQGQPLLCNYEYQHDLERLRKAFPKAHFACDYKSSDFKKIEEAFNAGEVPLLFGHMQSIGHGLNLQQAGHDVCFYAPTYDFELYDQFLRRVYRQGNKSARVRVHHIVARDTVDEIMVLSTKSKKKGQDNFFEALKNYRKR